MPDYFYTDDSGSESEDDDTVFTTQQAGTWASLAAVNVYPDFETATNKGAKTQPVAGDFVVIAQGHSFSTGAEALSLSLNGAIALVVSESDITDVAVAPVVQESATTGKDFLLSGGGYAYGLYVKSDDDTVMSTGAQEQTFAEKCTFELTGAGDVFAPSSGNGAFTCLIESTILLGDNTGSTITGMSNGARVFQLGGTIGRVAGASNKPVEVFGGIFGSRSGHYEGYGVNISDDVGDTALVAAYTNENSGIFELYSSRFNSAKAITSGTWARGQLVRVFGSGNTDDCSRQFYYRDGLDVAEQTTSFYITDDQEFTVDETRASIKVVTGADCSRYSPFIFKIPERFFEFSDSLKDAVEAYILSVDTLHDMDVGLFVISRAVGNEFDIVIVNTVVKPWGSTTTLPAGGQTWNNESSPAQNDYKIVADTAGASADGVPDVWFIVTKPNWTGYIGSEFGEGSVA